MKENVTTCFLNTTENTKKKEKPLFGGANSQKRVKKGTAIVIVVVSMVVGTIVGTVATVAAYSRKIDGLFSNDGFNSQKLNAIWNIVENRYVDRIESDTVMDRLYASMLNTLDPHSLYLTRKDLERENEALRGNFEGVGIVLQVKNDTVCASRIIEGGPSERVGIMAGDRILKVDGVCVSGVKMPSDSVVARLRGRRKSVTEVEIMRISEGKPRTLKIVRDMISTPSVTYSGMIDKQTGYIRISMFGETTYDEFCKATSRLKREGMRHMVLDLRGNGGGALSSAIGICDELLPGREMIVYTQGAHQRRTEHRSSPGGLFCEGKLTVMIDEYSASASEIVSGAIQDNDRGKVVGRRSFGKGLVQQQFELPDNTAILLTIARYYTPSGRCIQRPYSSGTDEYYADFARQVMDEYESAERETESGIQKAEGGDTTQYFTSKGRVVYGGGGIMPDQIIHVKTDPDIVYYNMLINRGIMNDFTLDMVSNRGVQIKKNYKNEDDFIQRFTVDDKMLQSLFALGERKGLPIVHTTVRKYREEIRSRIKAEIGEMLYSTAAFYKITLPYDPELEEAMKTDN